MSRPSVVFVNRVYPPDHASTGQLLSELAEALAQKGYDVTVLVSQTIAGSRSVETVNGVSIIRVRGLPFTRASTMRRALSYLSLYPIFLWRLLRMPKVDVLVIKTDPPLILVVGALLRLVRTVKLIHWAQDVYPEIAESVGVLKLHGRIANLVRRVSTWALRRFDHIVCVGRCMADRLQARGLSDARISVIPNWSDTACIHPVPIEQNSFRQSLDAEGRIIVMYSGNMGLVHPFGVILDAVERMHHEHARFLFLFIGEGPQLPWLKEQAKQRGLGNIRFLPFQNKEDLSCSLSAGDIHLASMADYMCGLVVPSKVIGILSVARPCLFLGSADSEAARMIAEHQAGIVLTSATADQLVNSLLRMEDAEARMAMGRRGRAFAEQEGLGAACDRFTAVLNRVSG